MSSRNGGLMLSDVHYKFRIIFGGKDMKTSVKRLLALLCVVAVGSATMASCKKDTVDQTSSEEYEIE